MNNFLLFCVLIVFVYGCSNPSYSEPEAVIKTKATDIQEFYREHFNPESDSTSIFVLSSDSLELKSLGITLFQVNMGSSHPTDYVVLRDNSTNRIFQYAVYNSYYIDYPNLGIISDIFDSNLEYEFSDAFGIEQLLNQTERQTKKPISIEQLDSIISFYPNLGVKRIKNEIDLNSIISSIFKSKNEDLYQIEKIRLYLLNKLNSNDILIYGTENHHLNIYEINPTLEPDYWELREKLYANNDNKRFLYALPRTNIRRTRIGPEIE